VKRDCDYQRHPVNVTLDPFVGFGGLR